MLCGEGEDERRKCDEELWQSSHWSPVYGSEFLSLSDQVVVVINKNMVPTQAVKMNMVLRDEKKEMKRRQVRVQK